MRKIAAILLMFALMLPLCGCQLAKGEELVETGYSMTDKLIGVFITEEHLNLFDMDAYLNDNLNSIISGKEIGPGEQAEYEGRIYATPDGYLENGKPDGYFTFEGMEGYAYFVPVVETEECSSSVVNSDSCFADIKTGSHHKDGNVREESVEATLYLVDDRKENIFYMNPVYQDEDGNVYLMAGTGLSTGYGMLGSMSQTMNTELKTTVDGVETTERYFVTINYKGVPRPETIAVLQMSADSTLLSREEYLPGQLPEQINPVEGAEYIIVETIGESEITREVVGNDERWLSTYDPQEDGVCMKQQTEVLWQDWDE